MMRPGMRGERTLALFFLGLLLFNPPLLSLFSVDRFFADVPLLYTYGAAWAGWLSGQSRRSRQNWDRGQRVSWR